MAIVDLTNDVGNQVLNPATHIPLMEMVYSDTILEDRFAKAGGLNFFNPEVKKLGESDLALSHSIRIRFKGYQNPFNIVGVSKVSYQDGETCPPVLDDLCDPGMVSAENSWRYEDVKFKNKFRIGVGWCVENEVLLYQDAEDRFGETVAASEVVMSTVGWSELVTQAIAEAADTLLPNFTLSTKHYYDAGATDPVEVLTKVFQYMSRVYGPRWKSEFAVFADPQLELDIIASDSSIHNYDTTGKTSIHPMHDVLTAGGFSKMAALPRGLWGTDIYLAPDVVDYYPTEGDLFGSNLNPFRNATGSKYYVLIASRRSFYAGAVSLMKKRHFPATAADKNEYIQQTWLSFYKLLFPKEVFVVAFNQEGFTSATPFIQGVYPSGASEGETVTIAGAKLSGATAVSFGGTAATSFVVEDDNEIDAVVPAGSAGSITVTVTTPGGSAPKTYTRG